MIRQRATPDGLPFRVYERYGLRVYSIGYKLRSGKWAFRFECPVQDARTIAKLRKKAILESTKVENDVPIGGFAGLVKAWFAWQEDLPASDKRKRAASTIAENRRESANLIAAWSQFEPSEITKTMGYEYLEACVQGARPEKGNKEMALARLILELGIRKRLLEANPLAGLTKNAIKRTKRRVTAQEMALAVEVGRSRGGASHIVAMGLRTAWLCVRRSVEVRAITRDAITEDGILWRDGKDSSKPAVLIEWSPELRATVDEAKAIKRFHVAGTMYLFGNMRGQRYTKGGWKAILNDLMTDCEKVAAERKIQFAKFSLQDCRPMGVTDKLERGDTDTQEATGHTDGKMIAKVYDRRSQKRAKPAA
jgi:integrase